MKQKTYYLKGLNMTNFSSGKGTCGCYLAVVAFNVTLGAWTFAYCLDTIFGRIVPWYADAVAGLFLGELTVPGAVICWIIKLCGVHVPFVH